MMDEDDIPEDVKRGVEKAMYGRPLVKTTVETKRRHFGDRMNETREEWLKRRRREEREKSGK
ncbi:hypothetical protein [Aquamicrobium soli]|uniref:Uncharacterized protein n=1 Tax=Aquamicrobium soli TaxID=1811518 RepID=A0ABV7KAL6_9HYPH